MISIINDIISLLTQAVQDDLTEVWPPLKVLTGIANHRQDAVLNFSIHTARRVSWANAVALSVARGSEKEDYIKLMDESVVALAAGIINRGFAMRLLLLPILQSESKNVRDIIDMLC